jgi:uncharacterized protein (TIGR03435 family)
MKSLVREVSLTLSSFLLVPAVFAAGPSGVGSKAPPLAFHEVLQAPAGTLGTWDELKGKAVILEFWETWCGGCVDSIPHLNELAEEFETRPVEFISITDETDVDLVKRFLGRHPVKGWIAFDAQEATFQNFGIEGRPRTILIGRDGVIRGVTSPSSVTSEILEQLLAGRSLNLPEERTPQLLGHESNAPQPLVQVLIRPAASAAVSGYSPGAIAGSEGRYEAYGFTLRHILSDAYNVPETRVDAPEWCRAAGYDLSVVTPQHAQDLRWLLVKETLEAAFQLKLHTEDKDTRVYVLRKLEGQQPRLKVAAISNGGHWSSGELEAEGSTTRRLVQVAQSVLGEEVLDETGLTEHYEFRLTWDEKQPASLIQAIREQLALELIPSERKRTHLVVDSLQEPKTW